MQQYDSCTVHASFTSVIIPGDKEYRMAKWKRYEMRLSADQFTAIFKGLGFKFVTLDLEGFRSGSMNALLSIDQLRHTG